MRSLVLLALCAVSLQAQTRISRQILSTDTLRGTSGEIVEVEASSSTLSGRSITILVKLFPNHVGMVSVPVEELGKLITVLDSVKRPDSVRVNHRVLLRTRITHTVVDVSSPQFPMIMAVLDVGQTKRLRAILAQAQDVLTRAPDLRPIPELREPFDPSGK